jgi:hypothetical protein
LIQQNDASICRRVALCCQRHGKLAARGRSAGAGIHAASQSNSSKLTFADEVGGTL